MSLNGKGELGGPSDLERESISSLSRPQVVDAYTTWTKVSEAEKLCLKMVLNEYATILDIGCGTGRHANWLNGRFDGYLGIDASAPMIEAAKSKYPSLNFVSQDILDFEVAHKSFNVVLLLGNVLDFLHPKERRAALFERCFNWLQPDGSLVGSSHLTHSNRQQGYYEEDYYGAKLHQFRSSASDMVAEIESHGFELSLMTRDYRKQPADWTCWIAKRPS